MRAAAIWIVIAGAMGAAGMALAAYHAHGLESWLEKAESEPEAIQKRLDWCGTAVRYHMLHAVAFLGVAWLASVVPGRIVTASGVLMMLGVAGFSGGLYEMTFRGVATHWSIVPLGGLLLIIAWAGVGVSGIVAARRPDASRATSS